LIGEQPFEQVACGVAVDGRQILKAYTMKIMWQLLYFSCIGEKKKSEKLRLKGRMEVEDLSIDLEQYLIVTDVEVLGDKDRGGEFCRARPPSPSLGSSTIL
jgi:hypothetical protein